MYIYRISFLLLIIGALVSCSTTNKYKSRSLSSEEISCRDSIKLFLVGARFLHKQDSTLHQSSRVSEASQGISKPAEKIAYWLSKMEKKISNENELERFKDIETLKNFYRKANIVKRKDVPESYFEAQQKISRERGHGDVEITSSIRLESIRAIRSDQKESLDIWIDYFLSKDADFYPLWVKYWSLEGMLKLGVFNEGTGKFSKRTVSTVAPFPELNTEAFAGVVDSLVRQSGGDSLEDLTDPIFKDLLKSGASFGRLYGRQLQLLKKQSSNLLTQTKGKWVKYKKGSSADKIVDSLREKNTGWCTAGHSTATSQLKDGDFYVYYSIDEVGEMSNPRLAIRMENDSIAEVRGIAENQNIDKYMANSDVLSQKLKEFGAEGDRYQKKSQDMKALTDISSKNIEGEELSKEELHFLYEMDKIIDGFGHEKDPRIKEIISSRDVKRDLSFMTGLRESEISLTEEEAISGGIKYHHGDLDISFSTTAKKKTLSQRIKNIFLTPYSRASEELILPEVVGGDLRFKFLDSANGLILPTRVKGNLELKALKSPEGLNLPEVIGGDLRLDSLLSVEDLKMPKRVGGNIVLVSIKSIERFKLPSIIGGGVYMGGLKSAQDLIFPESIGKDLDLNKLVTIDKLILPRKIDGYLSLRSLESIKELVLPESVKGAVELSSPQFVKEISIPKSLNRERIRTFVRKP